MNSTRLLPLETMEKRAKFEKDFKEMLWDFTKNIKDITKN